MHAQWRIHSCAHVGHATARCNAPKLLRAIRVPSMENDLDFYRALPSISALPCAGTCPDGVRLHRRVAPRCRAPCVRMCACACIMFKKRLTTHVHSLEKDAGFDYGTLYRNILQPFSNEVWFITLGMLVFGGLMMWFCELSTEDSPFKGEGIGGLFKSIWVSLMSFVCATAAHEASHWPGRIVMIGYAFFIYVTVVLYVANLSAFLIMKPSEGASISSLMDITRLGGKLCLLEAMTDAVSYAVPVSNQHLTDDYGPALERVYRGGCAAAVVGFFEYEMYVKAQTAVFTVCVDPDDEKGWSTCTNVPTDPVNIDLNCKCKNPEKDVTTCPSTCPFGNKRYCPLVEVCVSVDVFVSVSGSVPVCV